MPELPVMTGAELKSAREYLGLSWSWLAEYLACDQRRLQRMELDQELVPSAIAGAVDDLYEETADQVRRLTEKYRDKVNKGEQVTLTTYRTDTEYQRALKHARFQARWHRMVAQRVADALPGLVLVYGEQHRVNRRPWERQREPSK
jgi:ribosome-binding protein aMBF1 (putative translation factor)